MTNNVPSGMKSFMKVPNQKVARRPKCFSFFFSSPSSDGLVQSCTMLSRQHFTLRSAPSLFHNFEVSQGGLNGSLFWTIASFAPPFPLSCIIPGDGLGIKAETFKQHAFWSYLSCIIPDDGLGIKAKTLDFDETDLFQFLMINLSMVGTMSNNSYTTVDSQLRNSLKQ